MRRLLRVILEEIVRSPNRQADGREARRLYGDGFDVALDDLQARGYIADHAVAGHIALTAAGLAAAREAIQLGPSSAPFLSLIRLALRKSA